MLGLEVAVSNLACGFALWVADKCSQQLPTEALSWHYCCCCPYVSKLARLSGVLWCALASIKQLQTACTIQLVTLTWKMKTTPYVNYCVIAHEQRLLITFVNVSRPSMQEPCGFCVSTSSSRTKPLIPKCVTQASALNNQTTLCSVFKRNATALAMPLPDLTGRMFASLLQLW